MADPARFEILKDDLQSFVGTSGPLLFAVTRRPPTIASLEFFRDAMRDHVAKYPERVLLLVALRSRRPRLSQGARSMIVELWSEFGSRSVVGVWVGGQSFAKSLQRSFITALSLIRVRKTPFKVVADASDAVDWFVELEPSYATVRDDWLKAVQAVIDGDSPPGADV
ncbi:MAG: hypothetical protein AAF721_12625 [Myxococcota bacterium]